MRAELVAVGTELLLGQIANTNAQFLAEQCAAIGVDVYFQTVVGDNADRIKQAFEIARNRADVVICTGGLGPTQDDLTKDVLADYVGQSLELHQPSMDKINRFFADRGITMVESNVRQALMIAGSVPLLNETGMAVGNALTHEGTHYILLPGPPREMKPMFVDQAVPWLRSVMTGEKPLFSRMLRFAGIGESMLENRLLDLIEAQRELTIAPYAKEGEVAIRLTVRANSEAEAEPKLAEMESEIRGRIGEYLYATQDITIEQAIVEGLKQQGRTVAVAESCTGGLLSELITSIPGSSEVFLGGMICYTNAMKQDWLGIAPEVLEDHGAVSEQAAKLLAEQLLERTGADFALSVTGVAGPAESEGKPVGLVYIGLARKGAPTEVYETKQGGGRGMIRLRSAKAALYRLWKRM